MKEHKDIDQVNLNFVFPIIFVDMICSPFCLIIIIIFYPCNLWYDLLLSPSIFVVLVLIVCLHCVISIFTILSFVLLPTSRIASRELGGESHHFLDRSLAGFESLSVSPCLSDQKKKGNRPNLSQSLLIRAEI